MAKQQQPPPPSSDNGLSINMELHILQIEQLQADYLCSAPNAALTHHRIIIVVVVMMSMGDKWGAPYTDCVCLVLLYHVHFSGYKKRNVLYLNK